MSLLTGKVGLVTGAGRGIGRDIALRMAAEGAAVLVSDINAEGSEETAAMIRDAGGEAQSRVCDVTDEQAVQGLVQFAIDTWGRLDIACNNAALARHRAKLHQFKREDFDETVTFCLTNTWLCMKHELDVMLKAGTGAIVNISSNASLRGQPTNGPYSAAKSGVNLLTHTAAAEYGHRGIRINAVSPGVIRTPGLEQLFEQDAKMKESLSRVAVMGRLGEPREIAEAVVFLLSDRASFITGQILSVDGGANVR